MATPKRERQKAARRQKIEQMQRAAKRRQTVRRVAIVATVAVVVVVSAAWIFSSHSNSPSATTSTLASASSTTTVPSSASTTVPTKPVSFAKVTSPSPAGTWGKQPTVIVPAGKPPTQMEVSDLIKGTGPVAKIGSTLEVQYVLATYSSRKVIQASWTSSTGPFSFVLGAGRVIPGWDEGLVGMHVGGRRELIIPPALGYGASSPGAGIAANDTLVFVVDLLKVS